MLVKRLNHLQEIAFDARFGEDWRFGNLVYTYYGLFDNKYLLGGIVLCDFANVTPFMKRRFRKLKPAVLVCTFDISVEHRGKGLGKVLFETILKEHKRVALTTDNTGEYTNEAAIKIYERYCRVVRRDRLTTYWYINTQRKCLTI